MAISLPIVSKFDDKGVNDAQLKISAFQGIALGAFAKIGSAAVTAFADAAQAAVDFGKQSVFAAVEAQAVTRQLENAAKNSGAFGDTAASIKEATDALDKHSTKLAELSGIDDETINKIKSRWMTVPGIVALGTKGINHLADVSADVAAATGKDIESIGLMFTKVAGDSETALSKLTRAGVVLSDQQKKTYQGLIDTGKEAEAQAFLIEALAQKYSGAALAMASPFERMKVTIENLQESIGMAFMPALEAFVPKLQEFIDTLVTSPEFKQFIDDLGKGFTDMLAVLPGVMSNFYSFIRDIMPVFKSTGGLLVAVVQGIADAFFDIDQSSADGKTKSFADQMQYLADKISSLTTKTKEFFDFWNNLPNPFKEFLGGQGFMGGLYNWAEETGQRMRGEIPFATGGIVTGPTRALIGEAGPEAVIPLDRLSEVTGMGAGNTSTYNISVTAGMGADGAALGEQIVNAIRRYERTSGAVFARA